MVHIVIGTSISVFLALLLFVCGVYHRKKFRPRDRPAHDGDQVEVRYVAATSGTNTTDTLLTVDRTAVSRQAHPLEQNDKDHNDHVAGNNKMAASGTEQNASRQSNDVTVVSAAARDSPHAGDNAKPSTSSHSYHTHPRPVPAPKVQKVSIV